LSYLRKYFAGAEVFSAYEAGFSGFSLHRFLTSNGVNNIVVNAASIEVGARDRVKTDKRDSLKIATQLSVGRLKGIFIPPEEMEDRRELTRHRSMLVRDRSRTAARLKHKANYYGIIGPDDTEKVSSRWIAEQQAKIVNPGLSLVFRKLAESWHSINQEIKERTGWE
jgi:transposase